MICNKCLTPKNAFRPVSIQVQLVNSQCQTRVRSQRLQCQHGHHAFKLSMRNHWAQYHRLQSQTGHKHVNQMPNQWTQSRQLVSFKWGMNYSLTVIKSGVYSNWRLFRYLCYRLSLMYIFKRLARIYISVVKPVTDLVIS